MIFLGLLLLTGLMIALYPRLREWHDGKLARRVIRREGYRKAGVAAVMAPTPEDLEELRRLNEWWHLKHTNPEDK